MTKWFWIVVTLACFFAAVQVVASALQLMAEHQHL
jgi:hypothetical protein